MSTEFLFGAQKARIFLAFTVFAGDVFAQGMYVQGTYFHVRCKYLRHSDPQTRRLVCVLRCSQVTTRHLSNPVLVASEGWMDSSRL
jgi:hypothetical protein